MTTALRARMAAMPAFVLVLAGVTATDAWAQSGVIAGRVVNEQGAPIPGATVFVQSLNIGTTANATGNYTLTVPEGRATGATASLTARSIGFTPQTRTVTLSAGPQTQNFTLRQDPFRLSEVVVTGVSEATSTRNLTFSVAKVTEEQLKQVPASSAVAALAGKVSGARIAIGAGNPGAPPTVRLRASTSLGVGASSPLVIVDGVITRNSVQDIDANDIESIEVLKGAAAASFYGSDAANGVINITTKRSRTAQDSKTNFTLRSEVGQSGLNNFVPLNRSHIYETNADGSIRLVNNARVVKANQLADTPFQTSGDQRWRNQLEEWMSNGQFYSTNVQLGTRIRSTNFSSSFTTLRNQGILPMTNGLFQQNARLNVDQGLGSKADFSVGVTYGLQNNDYEPGSAAAWFELLQSPPDLDLRYPRGTSGAEFNRQLPTANSPSARANPLYQLANEDFSQRRERILGSAALRYRPFEWLNLEANYGTDRLNRRDRTFQFRGYQTEAGTPGNGVLNRSTNNNVAENTQLSATISKPLFGDNLRTTTRAVYLLENDNRTSFNANSSKLNISEVPDLAAADPTQLSVNSNDEFRRTINYMISEAVSYKDRYFIDALYRRDGSSLFGPDARWQNFYRVSGAYRINEDLQLPGFQELKLRAARGRAGLRPGFFDQYETYSVSAGQITKNQLGNANLKPAIQDESEFGINATFLNRFDAELVYAKRVTDGAFLNVPLSLAQSGGFTTQVQNAADISGSTFELMLQTRVIDRPNLGYSFTLTGDRTRQRIDRMNRAPFRVSAGGQSQDVFYYKAGENLGIIYGSRFVHTFAQLKENPANASAVESDYVVNPAGYLVLKARRGTPQEMPIPYVDANRETQFKIGDVNPDFSFGWANNLRWNKLGVYVLFDGQRGGDIYNFTKQWMFQDHRHGEMDQSGKPDDQKIANPFYASGLYNALVANEHFVEDGSFVKLRELSVSYNLSPSILNRVGVGRYASGVKIALIGRNLVSWTNYSGFDPEVTSGNDFNFRIDGFRYPQFRTVSGQVEISF